MATSVDELTKNPNITMFQWEIDTDLFGNPMQLTSSPEYKQSSNFFIPSDSSREYYLKLWPSRILINNNKVFIALVVRQVRNTPPNINKKERVRCIFFIHIPKTYLQSFGMCSQSFSMFQHPESFESQKMQIIASGDTVFDISETNRETEQTFILCNEKHATSMQQLWSTPGYPNVRTKLIISCVLQIVSQEQNSSTINSEQGNVAIPKSSLLSDFDKLVDGEDLFGDVVIIVDERELVAYKGILAARSPVFAAMFRSAMKESKENRVVIDDVEYEVVKEMLRYIHTDQAPNLSKMATKLFVAADKYQLLRLKTMCELHACSNLTTETVALDLLSALLHDGKKLKSCAIEYIKLNKQAVAQTKHWKDLMTNHSALLGQIILDFI